MRAVPCARCGAVRDPVARDEQRQPAVPELLHERPFEPRDLRTLSSAPAGERPGPRWAAVPELPAYKGDDLCDLRAVRTR